MTFSRGGTGLVLLAVALLVCIGAGAASGASDPYDDSIVAGIGYLELGAYPQAAREIDKALDLEPNAAPAHNAMGATLLLAGHPSAAQEEFQTALKASPGHPVARAGLALCALWSGDASGARSHLLAIQEILRPPWASDLIAYGDFLTGRSPTSHGTGPLGQAIGALAAGEEDADNVERLQVISRFIWKGRFEDVPGLIAAFDPSKPLYAALPVESIPRKRRQAPPSAKICSGQVMIEATMAGRPDVRYVIFNIDGRLGGITNSQPFHYRWDTTRFSNGIHTIEILGCSASGEKLVRETRILRVQNEGSGPSPVTELSPTDLRLLQLMAPMPSSKVVHYRLGRALASAGDLEGASAAFEYVIAIDPDYRDARRRLIECYGRLGSSNPIWSRKTNEKVVALTFDDGPNPATTLPLLDALEQEGVAATFFVVGMRAQSHPDLVRKIQDGGHAIGNHTFSHPRLTQLGRAAIEKQILRTVAVVRETTGRRMTLFRPPGGHIGPVVQEVLRTYGIRPVFWTVNCSKLEGGTPRAMAQYVLDSVKEGGIILMHNGEASTLQALPMVLRGLKERGYRFVTVDELLRLPAVTAGSPNEGADSP